VLTAETIAQEVRALGPATTPRLRAVRRRWTRTLNVKNQGGSGDIPRTLAVCALLVDDRDDMVVKALSWALRELVGHDPGAVDTFLDQHAACLARRVQREVRSKLTTGLKAPRRQPTVVGP
jgi:3-methyladenine DNA glycosylase AlkD